jgi:putative endonuclease
MEKVGYVYILSNWTGQVLYTGVTSDLKRRVYEHKNKLRGEFSKKYCVDRLVYYEVCPDISSAIQREKQFKGGSRKKKIDAIQSINPNWDDLYSNI